MSALTVASVLERLSNAATTVQGGWLPVTWRRTQAVGAQQVSMSRQTAHFLPVGVFDELRAEPGATTELTTTLDLPEQVAGHRIVGEPLELMVNSLFPTQVAVGDRDVFADDFPVVASGPALVRLLDALRAGDNGALVLRILKTDNHLLGDWRVLGLTMHFTTPGLRERFAALDLAYARLLLADAVANDAGHRGVVDRAAALVPTDLLALSTQQLHDVAGELADALSPLASAVERYKVHCVGHSHIDLAWLWRWDDTREVLKRDARSILALMRDYPEFRFTHSQPAGYAMLQREEPQLFAEIRERITAGQWEPATLQWVESDTNLASGPAQAAQIDEAVRYSREHLGVRPSVHLAPDTFGHAGNLPQLSVSGGGRVYYHHRGNPGQVAGGGLQPAYWWEGDDGTRILAISTPAYLGPLSAGRIAQDVINLGIRTGIPAVCYFYGVGDHGGGPTRQSLETLRALRDAPGLPRIRCSTVSEFADAVATHDLPVHRGESITIFEGCYVSHADAKRNNRDGENALVTAANLAAVAGIDRGSDLSAAWRRVLFGQFHDILGGSAIAGAYTDHRADIDAAITQARRVTGEAIARLSAGSPPGTWTVTNPVGHDRSDPVLLPAHAATGDAVAVDAAGRSHAVQHTSDGSLLLVADVAAFDTVSYRLRPAAPPDTNIAVDEHNSPSYDGAAYYTVDTAHFYAQVRRDCGVITTLYDKRHGRELVGYGMARAVRAEQVRPDLALGVLQLVDEHPHVLSSWVVDEVHNDRSLIRGAQTRVVEHGPVRLVFETRHCFRASSATIRLIFWAELPRVDVELDVDWHEVGSAQLGVSSLLLSFGTRLPECEAWYETPFAAARRPADGLVVPALRWADIGGADYGLAVLNDGKYGWEALGPRLRVHLARSSYDPDPGGDAGRLDRSRFAIMPHAGSWREADVVAAAAAFNAPLIAGQASADTQPARPWCPRLVGDRNLVIGELRHRAGVRLVRVYEATGRPGRARLVNLPDSAVVHEANLAGDRGRRLAVDPAGLELALHPFQVRTLLME